jgi:hypothetical protein
MDALTSSSSSSAGTFLHSLLFHLCTCENGGRRGYGGLQMQEE